ncbi:MAG TPA: TMEM175 family protein [Candidatus Acidoferrales bacterium]|nr:TMEM175 family protein [Candidatus Acidoferrales bacterium]
MLPGAPLLLLRSQTSGGIPVITETARVEAFSDGVFAIAITLLILDIKVPNASGGPLAHQLLVQWPFYFSFVISFAFIGIMWINHHRLFTHIKRSDDLLLILNLLLLLGVTSVPFPTAVLAANLGQPGQRTATVLFNATYLFIAVIFNLLWRYATSRNHHLLAANADFAAADRITRQYLFGPLLYLICLGLAWISVTASLALNATLACFFAFPPEFVSSSRGKRARASAFEK